MTPVVDQDRFAMMTPMNSERNTTEAIAVRNAALKGQRLSLSLPMEPIGIGAVSSACAGSGITMPDIVVDITGDVVGDITMDIADGITMSDIAPWSLICMPDMASGWCDISALVATGAAISGNIGPLPEHITRP